MMRRHVKMRGHLNSTQLHQHPEGGEKTGEPAKHLRQQEFAGHCCADYYFAPNGVDFQVLMDLGRFPLV